MKFSFPTKAQFCETVKTAPQKIGYAASKEIKALKQDPLQYATNCALRYGRGVGGGLWMWGDASLYTSSTETTLAHIAGYVCAPATLAFVFEPLLGKKFGRNKNQQPVVPIGPYKVNSTKLGYKGFAVTTSLLLLDGMMHLSKNGMSQVLPDIVHGVQALVTESHATLSESCHAFANAFTPEAKNAAGGMIQATASGFATYGSLQAGWKEKGDLEVVDESKIVKEEPKGTVKEQLKKDNEVQGVGKLLMENGLMMTSAIILGRPEMLMAYLRWTSGNVVIVGRRVFEIFQQNKDRPKPEEPQKAVLDDRLKV